MSEYVPYKLEKIENPCEDCKYISSQLECQKSCNTFKSYVSLHVIRQHIEEIMENYDEKVHDFNNRDKEDLNYYV